MADGFALRGFTQGFTQGLQNIDQLATNWQTRDLRQKEVELQREQQDRQNRYNDYLIKNMERTADRQDRQDALSNESHGLDMESKRYNLDKQQMEMDLLRRKDDANRLYSVLNPDNPESVNITDEDLARMERLGLRPFADYDPNKINAMADRLARGEGLDDPEVMQAIKDAYTVKAQRQLGRGIKPGQQYAATGAETGESVPKPGEMVMPAVKTVVGMKAVDGGYVPIVRVEGATAGDKRYVSYEAPYTEKGMSSEEDRPVRVTPQQMADTLRGAGYVSARLQANPALLERLRGQVVSAARGIPEQPDALTQSKIENLKSMGRSRDYNDRLNALKTEADLAKTAAETKYREYQLASGEKKDALFAELEQAKAEERRTMAEFNKARTETESSVRDRNYAAADYSDSRSKGLGSVGKPGKKPAFKQKDVMERAKALYRSESGDMPGMPVAPEVEQRRFKFFNDVQTLVVDAGVDQDKAMHWVQNNPREIRKRASDGRQFEAVVVKGDDGKNQYFPVKWLD